MGRIDHMVMSPRIWIVKARAGSPDMPSKNGGDDIFERVESIQVGGKPAWEYRHPSGKLIVVQYVADLPGARFIAVAWVPQLSRKTRDRPIDIIMRRLPCVVRDWAVDDDWTSPDLQADVSVAAMAVKAAWPSGWRLRAIGDDPGDPINGIPAAPPTGAQYIASGLA